MANFEAKSGYCAHSLEKFILAFEHWTKNYILRTKVGATEDSLS